MYIQLRNHSRRTSRSILTLGHVLVLWLAGCSSASPDTVGGSDNAIKEESDKSSEDPADDSTCPEGPLNSKDLDALFPTDSKVGEVVLVKEAKAKLYQRKDAGPWRSIDGESTLATARTYRLLLTRSANSQKYFLHVVNGLYHETNGKDGTIYFPGTAAAHQNAGGQGFSNCTIALETGKVHCPTNITSRSGHSGVVLDYNGRPLDGTISLTHKCVRLAHYSESKTSNTKVWSVLRADLDLPERSSSASQQ